VAVSLEPLETSSTLLYSDKYGIPHQLSAAPKHVTLNDFEWLFYVKSCFCACSLRTVFMAFENCHMPSAAGMQIRDSSFWQYKVCADICWISVERRCQTTVESCVNTLVAVACALA